MINLKEKKHFVFIFVLSFCLIFFNSCSHLLNELIIPFAPDFLPEMEETSGGTKISYSISSEKNYAKDKKSYKRDYAFYIWRSTIGPYDKYDLIARIYIPGASAVYYGYDTDGKQTKYDFTIPNDDINISCNKSGTTSGTFLDRKSLSKTCYYRVTKITLNCTYSENDDGTSLSYSLGSKTSGWLSAGESESDE